MVDKELPDSFRFFNWYNFLSTSNQMNTNIFTYNAPRGELADLFYQLLISGEMVSYEKTLTEYDGGELSTEVSKHDCYKTLKHVVSDVVNTLRNNGFSVVAIPNGRTTSYQYVGANKNPLENLRFKALIQEREQILSKSIASRSAVRIAYKPFDKDRMEVTFHPHLLCTYNDRKFVLGVSEIEGQQPLRKLCMALDRIEGDIKGSGAAYIPTEKNEYKYLAYLVGVSFVNGAELTTIRLRAHSPYTFGLLKTKPIHDSQVVVEYPDSSVGRSSGDVEITVYPNKELIGKILSYGNMLEVVSPSSFRERVNDELKQMICRYEK